MQEAAPYHDQTRAEGSDRTIVVHLNEQPVTLTGPRHTGLEIKQAAIAQGVRIQLDFALSVERGQGQTQIIDDGESITVSNQTRFVAIPDDDNS